jgi:hypothetical protein
MNSLDYSRTENCIVKAAIPQKTRSGNQKTKPEANLAGVNPASTLVSRHLCGNKCTSWEDFKRHPKPHLDGALFTRGRLTRKPDCD